MLLPFFKTTTMLKIYKCKDMCASLLFKKEDGKHVRILFEGGTQPRYEGIFSTTDEAIQKLIETDKRFGEYLTSFIFLYKQYPTEGEVSTEKKTPTPVPEVKKIGFVEAKQMLIEKGIQADNLKNFAQVKKEAKAFGIEL